MLDHVGTNDIKTGRVCPFGRQMIADLLVSVTGMCRHSTDNGLLFDSISCFKQAPASSQRDLATACEFRSLVQLNVLLLPTPSLPQLWLPGDQLRSVLQLVNARENLLLFLVHEERRPTENLSNAKNDTN